jgi:hypothetical protein
LTAITGFLTFLSRFAFAFEAGHIRRMKATMLIILGIIFVSAIEAASPVAAHTPAPSPTPPCVAPEFRQFDFWLGHWKVTNPKGKQVGTSEISRVSEGCAIREQWKSVSGSNGMSINYYDSADYKWHQDWVGGDGLILHLEGNLVGSVMVLSGASKSTRGTVLNRITWTPLPDGKVKQEWKISPDNGRTWKTSFVGIYEKQP